VERSAISKCKRIVVKVGTSTVTHATGKINLHRMERLAREISDLASMGREIVLISSGAVGAGLGKLNRAERPRTLPEKQAMASIGQGRLMHMYEKFFSEYGNTVAQVLLTRDVFSDRLRFLNARNTILTLLEWGVIPVINENDTVAVEELRFGDNDTLSAMVASLTDADLTLILSDIDGLYDDNPRTNPDATIIPEVAEITDAMFDCSHGRGSRNASGGMYTKLLAAKICMAAGIPMVIAKNDERDVIRRIACGEPLGTLFLPARDSGDGRCQGLRNARKHWIAFESNPTGRLIVDEGAAEALRIRGKSLLPSGVVRAEGLFDRGAVVSVVTEDGREIARGIACYSSEDVSRIAGRHTDEIGRILGSKDYDVVIHRNNMAVL
jgi:glutamate 5-kinase